MNNRHPPPQQKSCWDEGRNKRGRRGPQTPACDSLQQRSFAKLGRTTTPRSVRLAHLSLSFLSRWGPAFRPKVPIKTTEGKKKKKQKGKKKAKRRTASLTGRFSRELTELWLFPRRPRERTSGGGLPRGPALSERGRALAGISPFWDLDHTGKLALVGTARVDRWDWKCEQVRRAPNQGRPGAQDTGSPHPLAGPRGSLPCADLAGLAPGREKSGLRRALLILACSLRGSLQFQTLRGNWLSAV